MVKLFRLYRQEKFSFHNPKGILLKKAQTENNPFAEVFGIIKSKETTDDYLLKIRGPVE